MWMEKTKVGISGNDAGKIKLAKTNRSIEMDGSLGVGR